MSTMVHTPTSVTHTIDCDRDRNKLLRRVMRESGWTMSARAEDDWRITFNRTVKGKPGDPDLDIKVTIDDKITLAGRYGEQQSFSDSKRVFLPTPTRVWLSYGSVATAAKFLIEKSHFLILGSYGSTHSSEYGLAFVSLNAMVKGCDSTVTIGHESVYVHGKMVICGSVE